ncbi:type I glutamate--ammonia ligase [Candidatus Endowatersipora endosymbiont of Watersipora subatra]|uniref:type I glutamate--ammonia ligase n=1 Tax=Candidatus Endowatersipora endosymbiont of Watersipora subatra TaxID=3077946 RepID=UPI00312CAFF0
MLTANDILKRIKDNDIKFVDLRFTDPYGKMHHVTMDSNVVKEDLFADGVMFDGSSIAGWKEIDDSDMSLMPDPKTVYNDPFYSHSTIAIFCDILEPFSGEGYNRDPRMTAKRAEAYVKAGGFGDTAYFGPEPEFFLFDDVRFSTKPYNTSFHLDDIELPINMDSKYEAGNMGHRPRVKAGYFPVNPVDSAQDIRSEMLTVMSSMGIETEKHHHEVAPAQHELSMIFNTLTTKADEVQLYKYAVHNVAKAYGKSATFMPKPVFGDNGTGMHVHQSVWKEGKPLFAGDQYAGLSDSALYYIGGIIKHAKSLNAFTNPSTNSYKRLVPGYEAPVLLAYSACNRSASCRIPYSPSSEGKRVEIRFPDPMANPYLSFSAMLMAGLDGIKNKIDPGEPMDKDLYDLPKRQLENIPTVCESLREAINALRNDNDFLKQGDVFNDDQIDAYLELKEEENSRYQQMPHPIEFDMYYSL